jgi:hypothetical protein
MNHGKNIRIICYIQLYYGKKAPRCYHKVRLEHETYCFSELMTQNAVLPVWNTKFQHHATFVLKRRNYLDYRNKTRTRTLQIQYIYKFCNVLV